MKKLDILKTGLSALAANKVRTTLTMLGIVFGIAAVISMLSISEGAKQEALEQIELLGTNNIIINKAEVFSPVTELKQGSSSGLTLKDAKAIKDIIPFIESVVPLKEKKCQVTYKSSLHSINILGTVPEYLETFNSRLLMGSFIKDFHSNSYANVCVIGSSLKDKLFRFESPLNKAIKIDNNWFIIIGVTVSKSINETGMRSLGLKDSDEDIYVPFSTLVSKLEEEQSGVSLENIEGNFPGFNEARVIDRISVDQITVKIKETNQSKEAAYLIGKILKRRHNGINDYKIVIPEQLLAQKQRTQGIFNIVMGAIAGISLLVGGIGIMNIMLANLMERTHEIGIRRAVGATRNSIIIQFLYEALLVSITGGILGIILGFALTSIITRYAMWKTIITPISVFSALFISVIVGLVFGIYPAKKAADKHPIEALRYE